MRRLARAAAATLVVTLGGCGSSGGSKASPTTSAALSGRARASGTAEGFCELTRGFYDRVTAMSRGLSDDPAKVRQFVDAVVAAAQEAADAAPPEISADARLLTGAAIDYAHGLEKAGYDSKRLSPDDAAKLTRPGLADASKRVQDYEAANCDSSGTPTDGSGS